MASREISPYKGVAKQAAKMAAVIREKGWVQGAYSVPDGRVCLVGSALVGRRQTVDDLTQDAVRVLSVVGSATCTQWSNSGHGDVCAAGFNDNPETNQEDVLAVLDLLAETA